MIPKADCGDGQHDICYCEEAMDGGAGHCHACLFGIAWGSDV